jgi:hypothetical protein
LKPQPFFLPEVHSGTRLWPGSPTRALGVE